MKKAAHRIYQLGARNVVVKGGHLKGKPIDVLYDGKRYYEIEGPRIETKNTHGTGCTFASAIATLLARGETIEEAVKRAKTFMTMAIRSGLSLGRGTGPTNPFAYVLREMERYSVIQELKKAVDLLKKENIGHLIPEVSSNLGYALPQAEGVEDVAAFPGRIVRWKGFGGHLGRSGVRCLPARGPYHPYGYEIRFRICISDEYPLFERERGPIEKKRFSRRAF